MVLRLMLAKRIIPTILCRDWQLVKGIAFDSWRSVGLAAQAVRIHQARGVDELCLLDISATKEGRGPCLALVEDLANACFMPLSVGGGVRSVQDVRDLLHAGADKIVIGSSIRTIRDAASIVGSQAIVASVDVRNGMVRGVPPDVWAITMERYGAGEILLQCVERDGTLAGYDLALIRKVSQAVSIPVIASGGCGTYEHMAEAILAGADAVAAGAMFQFTDATPKGAAQYLATQGMEVRL